jgi:hypothetical protein
MTMNYKGDYAGGTSYSVGDVVVYTDGVAYQKIKASGAGITPHDVRIWQRVPQPMQDVIKMFNGMLKSISSGLVELEGMIPRNISDEAITLKDDSDNEYLITVDASGDTPELVVTAVTEEAGET